KNFNVEIGKLKDSKERTLNAETSSKDTLGLTVMEVDSNLAQRYGINAGEGVIITDVEPQGKTAEAGIRPGDIILELNQHLVNSLEEYNKAVKSIGNKKSVLLVIKRRGQVMFVPVTLK
ncbi:MAG: PDZ domain-containing protein, partial [Nitrospinae bacterium]|nr:PDZ domain-containing protein [Nitrospinota bacterium]